MPAQPLSGRSDAGTNEEKPRSPPTNRDVHEFFFSASAFREWSKRGSSRKGGKGKRENLRLCLSFVPGGCGACALESKERRRVCLPRLPSKLVRVCLGARVLISHLIPQLVNRFCVRAVQNRHATWPALRRISGISFKPHFPQPELHQSF